MNPTLKKVLRRSALGVLLVFVVLISLVFLLRWRTIGQWNDFKARWEAQGEHFDIEHFIPDPIPDEENLAMHPVFRDLWIEGSETAQRIETIDVGKIEGYSKDAARIVRQQGRQNDFSKWNGLDANLSPEDRAAEILRRMEPLSADMNRVAQALQERSQCQFPIDWDAVFTTETSQIFAFLDLSKAFALRASLRVQNGDSSLAVDDLMAVRRLTAAIGQEDSLVALLVEIALFHIYLNGTWDGITRHAFDDTELARLEAQLPDSGYLSERCLQSLRFERAAGLQVIGIMENDPGKLSPGSTARKSSFLSLWWASNRLALSEDLQEQLLSPGGISVTRPTLADAARFRDAFERRADRFLSEYTQAIALMVTPTCGRAVAKVLQLEAELDNARVAIAVERYRLKHGAYPPDLATLVPGFLPALPVDEINHRPLEYRLRPDGTPMIYQWGGDGDDDGGTPRRSLLHGDVVWQYPLDPPIDRLEYRRED